MTRAEIVTSHKNGLNNKVIKILIIPAFVLNLLFGANFICFAQKVNFQSSNLPIIVIDTDGQKIPDEPKITAHMGIINNGEGHRNYLTDSFNEYDGKIGIELRGKSSQNWPKKPYGFETRDEKGGNNNVSLFGMPKENDWILHAPYVDKTLMRNVFMYKLAAELGWYAPRTQFCELVINGEYMGVFVLIEKLKRDKNRVNLANPDDVNMSGGYLLEMIINRDLEAGETHFKLQQSGKEIVIKFPKPDSITPEQRTWISHYVNEFESVLNSDSFKDSTDGYAKYIDVPSFIDYMLLSEGFGQLDAFSHSVYFYKDKNKKLFLGPGWDYNRCMGNAKYFTSWSTTGWWLKTPLGNDPSNWYRIKWPARLMDDPAFMQAYGKRWFELRETTFSYDHLYNLIDAWVALLQEARVRNFERWPVLGVSINNKYAFDTYQEEIDYMKAWIKAKFTWLDEQFNLSENCALNNLSAYSSQEEDPFNPATNAVDGDESTRWSAQYFPQWLEIDCGAMKQISKAVVVPYQLRAYQYKIEAKADLWDAYSIIVDRQGNTKEGSDISDSFDPKNVRYVKLTVTGAAHYNGDWVSILEFKIFGETITGIARKAGGEDIVDFYLAYAYPNPFNNATTIYFEIPQAGHVKIVVYDIMGREAATLVNSRLNAGAHKIRFDASHFFSGIYFFKIYAGQNIQTGKITVLK